MEKISAYPDSSIQENVLLIGERREEYIRHLDYEIEQFNKKFEIIEKRCSDSNENADRLLMSTAKAIIDMWHAAEEFEKMVGYDKAIVKEAQIKFREKTNHIFSKSYYNRARIWPQGYQGDYEIIEFHYRNVPLSHGIGYYLDKYLLATTLAIAVRERKEMLRDMLKTELDNRKEPKILDIACGSCREVIELAPEIKNAGAKVICVDLDSDALDFAASRLQYVCLPSEQFEFRKYNAVRMVNHERNLKEFGMQDVIYSVGLFDYLEDAVLIRLLSSLYKLVSPGGKFIASFKDCRRYATFIYHWLIDWNGFLQRTEEAAWDLYEKAGIPLTAVTAVREKSGVITFFTANK